MVKGSSRLVELVADVLAFNLRNRDRWIAAQVAALPAGAHVIDVGAGSAPYRGLLRHCNYVTQDFAQLADAQLRHGGYAKIDIVCDATRIPVASNSFDAVLCSEVLEHHPKPIDVVYELGRILKPGGKLILTAPLGSGIHQAPYHFYGGFTPFWYQQFLVEAGFVEIQVSPNEGSLRHISQETVRLARMTGPGRLGMPWYWECVWFPIWLALLPTLVVAVPIAAKLLDRFDKKQDFTVGYHVSAIRA